MRIKDTDTTEAAIERSRMSFGEHLEELRKRMIRALLGLLLAFIICFNYGSEIISTLTTPYTIAMRDLGFDPRMVQLNPIESFMEYFKISLEFGLVLAAPWMLYQLWQFIAAGLYEHEKRVVRHFAPASIFLFVTGASFMVVFVLSGLMKFLIGIALWFPLPTESNPLYQWLESRYVTTAPADSLTAIPPMHVPVLTENPKTPAHGDVWINRTSRHLNAYYDGQTYYTSLQKAADQQFVQPFFSISEYLNFVVNLGLAFGLGFQIPIVVVFLAAINLVTVADMAKARRYVIVGVVVLSAVLTPTPDIGTMLLLAVPMLVLFEVGLLVARSVEKKEDPAKA
ncbi:MAG: twin-arginine translocase subunit TatC [Planctomycetes bacterium]|nr:twin-arginine translocase subunit TatC [Planctomycetota bacterium]